jgi:hypothetical protein
MNKYIAGSLLFFSLLVTGAYAQERNTQNVIVITLDGYRWNELFNGADPRIVNNSKYVSDTSVVSRFFDPSPEVSRAKVMPFFWNVIANEGQLYGNRGFNNKVNCTNSHLLSYPGYSEMLVGFKERKISSNDAKENPNATVLEFIHNYPEFSGKVAAFATWDVFPYILREAKSNIYVNAGHDMPEGQLSLQEKWLNENQELIKNKNGSRYDEFTFRYALQYLKRERPRVMFIGFDETDSNGHGGKYDEYLKSAHHADKMIGELWAWIQSQPDYKDQTTLFITTDHGRGKGKNTWKNHRLLAAGSRHIWFAVLGPDTPAFGEMKFRGKYYQKQTAKTIAAFLGLEYKHSQSVGEIVQTMLAVPIPAVFETTTAENRTRANDLDN